MTDKTESQQNEKVKSRKEENKDYENEYENENEDHENENECEYENENEDEDYDETIDQNKIIKEENDFLDKIIDKKIIWRSNRIIKKSGKFRRLLLWPQVKIKLADMSDEIDKKLFEKIFGHTLIKLADKLINTTNKKENQIIVKNI